MTAAVNDISSATAALRAVACGSKCAPVRLCRGSLITLLTWTPLDCFVDGGKMLVTKPLLSTVCVVGCLARLGDALEEDTPSGPTVVQCETTKGTMKMDVFEKWSPIGAQRFLELVEDEFFTDHPLYRCVDNFIIQFGVSGIPAVNDKWSAKGTLADDVNLKIPFKYGMVSFAGGGPATRDTSLFFAASRNQGQLDWWGREAWETPFAQITDGLDVLDKVYKDYGGCLF